MLFEEGEDVDCLGGGGEVQEVLRVEGLDGGRGDLDLEGVEFGTGFCRGTCRAYFEGSSRASCEGRIICFKL